MPGLWAWTASGFLAGVVIVLALTRRLAYYLRQTGLYAALFITAIFGLTWLVFTQPRSHRLAVGARTYYRIASQITGLRVKYAQHPSARCRRAMRRH